MPINNDILGIYKSVFITVAGGTARSYIVESASRSITIDASPKVLMQGSPKTRIMDIGGVTETISIQAPILIGGGASADGRSIATQKINEILDPTSATLPILKSASFSINEGGGSVSLTLESDGDSGVGTSAFFVTNSNTPHPSLNPVGTGGSGTTAKIWFDPFLGRIETDYLGFNTGVGDTNVAGVLFYDSAQSVFKGGVGSGVGKTIAFLDNIPSANSFFSIAFVIRPFRQPDKIIISSPNSLRISLSIRGLW